MISATGTLLALALFGAAPLPPVVVVAPIDNGQCFQFEGGSVATEPMPGYTATRVGVSTAPADDCV